MKYSVLISRIPLPLLLCLLLLPCHAWSQSRPADVGSGSNAASVTAVAEANSVSADAVSEDAVSGDVVSGDVVSGDVVSSADAAQVAEPLQSVAPATTPIPELPAEGESGGALAPASDASPPLITNDAVLLGLLLAMLGVVFWTSSSPNPRLQTFYKYVPMLLLCYFLPSLLTLFGLVDPHASQLYYVASRYLLPASLVLLTLSVDLREILKLGPKALIMFLTGTLGVILGGPLAILIVGLFAPGLVGGEGPDAVWRGMTTVAGSWIGGGANQAAMKEVFEPSDQIYSVMVTVDVLVAEFWMMFLLLGIGKAKQIDAWFKADASSVTRLQKKMEAFSLKSARIPTVAELFAILAVGFGCTAISHAVADWIAPWIKLNAPYLSALSLDSAFFWLIILATTLGVGLSFTPLRNLEGAGASKLGTVFIFILVATIGLGMDLSAIVTYGGLFIVGLVWMAIHVLLLVVVGYWIRSPFFFLAVGSKANIGGAASAPVIAAAFHPALAPVGVLLAVMGYVLGTYGAWLCGLMMRAIAEPGAG
ncbi:DUF819 family protein [Aureliella helgolandensis]|uniref:DUF819 domain-containing protein n=1 Tax=Aureliella helgolandensis TaxID=2527968 RepID=A0A518G3A3_9BACT|nr:DUF819 family protein [Aureliella helgolandensis]QDV23055.1 hypothetical protein Q31a_13500 [Aureliella helgolandensis]